MFSTIDETALFVVAVPIFLAAIEVFFRLGLRRRARVDDASRSHVNALQPALIGLLLLLLGFRRSR